MWRQGCDALGAEKSQADIRWPEPLARFGGAENNLTTLLRIRLDIKNIFAYELFIVVLSLIRRRDDDKIGAGLPSAGVNCFAGDI